MRLGGFRAFVGATVLVVSAAPARACTLDGEWFHYDESGRERVLSLDLSSDRYEFDGVKGAFTRGGEKLTFTPNAGDQTTAVTYGYALAYNGSYEKETLTLSGGNLEKPMVFARVRRPKKKAEAVSDVLSWSPAAKAHAGDWSLLGERAPGTKDARLYTVAATKDDSVTLEVHDRKAEKPARIELSRKDPPSAGRLLADLASGALAPARAEKETLTIDGREFACAKLTLARGDDDGAETWTVWLSQDVRGPGIVALTVTRGPKREVVLDLVLRGFGTAAATEWGRTPDAER